MWIPAFMKQHFWAGMKTTQRLESINSFFDGFLNRHTKLHEFPEKYTRAMAKRVKSELAADARCGKYIRRLVSGFKLERFFQKIYTDVKFQEVQKECARMMYVYSKGERTVEENVTEYLLEDRVWMIPEGKRQEVITDRRRLLRVLFNSVTKEVSCDCRKFETFGILCKHVIRVFDQNLVFDIPSKYVLDRWRKDVPRKHTRVKVAYHDPSERDQVRQYYKLMHEFEPICEEASSINDPETVAMVISCLQELSLNVEKSRQVFLEKQAKLPTLPRTGVPPSEKGSNQVLKCNGGEAPSSVVKASSIAAAVKDPIPQKKPRGRPKVTRYKSLAETSYKTQQKKPTQTKATQQKTRQTH